MSAFFGGSKRLGGVPIVVCGPNVRRNIFAHFSYPYYLDRLLVRRGGCRINKKSAKPTLERQTGGRLQTTSLVMTTPSAPPFLEAARYRACASRVASRHFHEAASTPPHEEGTMPNRVLANSFAASMTAGDVAIARLSAVIDRRYNSLLRRCTPRAVHLCSRV